MQNPEWPDNLTLSFVQISQQINGKLGTNDNNGRQHLPGSFLLKHQLTLDPRNSSNSL